MMKMLTEKQKRERKFLLLLPMLTLPFICLTFWALGGGKMRTDAEKPSIGLNLGLPEASLELKPLDKMESYKQAERNERQLREQIRIDPFAASLIEMEQSLVSELDSESALAETEIAMQLKIEELEALIEGEEVINEAEPWFENEIDPEIGVQMDELESVNDPELQKLESMMASAFSAENEDPEMERIDNLLDKLLDVQHPERVEKRLMVERENFLESVYSVSTELEEDSKDRLEEDEDVVFHKNRFYSLEDNPVKSISGIKPAISAEVSQDQEVVSGASVELQLTQPVYIEGIEFGIGTPVTGVATLVGERLKVEVTKIRLDDLIIPVSLTAIDLDGITGIRIPDSITRNTVKQGAVNGLQAMNQLSVSNTWESQASLAGLETVKGILSKKAKLIKVTVKAGHPLLLIDSSNN